MSGLEFIFKTKTVSVTSPFGIHRSSSRDIARNRLHQAASNLMFIVSLFTYSMWLEDFYNFVCETFLVSYVWSTGICRQRFGFNNLNANHGATTGLAAWQASAQLVDRCFEPYPERKIKSKIKT